MADKLPNELIKEILEPVLDTPDDLFHDVSDIPPFTRFNHVSAIPLLTICKSWMQVAIMLFYRVIILRSKAQVYTLERVLQANPHFGSYARKLRVEGGFGEVMRKIILLSPNINDLFLSLDISLCDSTKGLCSSLATLNLSCVTLWEPSTNSKDQKTAAGRNLNASVATCLAQNWKKMVIFF